MKLSNPAAAPRRPDLEATRHHVGSFANMTQNLGGDRLPDWIDAVRAPTCPPCTASRPA